MAQAAEDQGPSRAGADLSNWRTPAFRRWSLRNIREIIPSAEIGCAPDDVQPLGAAPKSLEDFRLAGADGASLGLDQFLAATATSAVVVMQDGRIVHEAYDLGMTARTAHMVMSISKTVLGLVAGRLSADGRLDLDALASDYVPEIGQGAYRGATLRHLLDMRAGVVLSEDEQRTYNAAGGWEPQAGGDRAGDLHGFFETMTASAARHGGPFRYVSANSELLGWAIERATGQTFAQLVSDLLWKPMGAEAPAYITLDRRGAPRCTGGMCMTARDLARIGQLMIQGGVRAGRQVIPGAWIDDVLHNGDSRAWKEGEFARAFPYPVMTYRGGWYVIESDPRTLFAMGTHGQNLFIDPANRLVIAKLSFHETPFDYRLQVLTHQSFAEIRRCLLR